MSADASYPNGFQVRQGGNAAVPTGKSLDIESGGELQIAGTAITATAAEINKLAGNAATAADLTKLNAVTKSAAEINALVGGVAGAYILARGVATLDGSNPTSVTTGLATVVSATVALKSSTAPGDDPSWFSVDFGGGVTAGQLDIYAWKNTGGTDPTLVASTNSSAVVSWIAIGT